MDAIKMKTKETIFRYCRSLLLLRNNNTNTACTFNIITQKETEILPLKTKPLTPAVDWLLSLIMQADLLPVLFRKRSVVILI